MTKVGHGKWGIIDVGNPYRVREECESRCKIELNGRVMKDITLVQSYAGREMTSLQMSKVAKCLEHVMKDKAISMEIKKNTMIL